MSRYRKGILTALGAAATWGITAAADDRYSQVELWGGLAAVVTAVSVIAVKNEPPAGERRRADTSEAER